MASTQERFTPEHERRAFALLLEESRQLSDRVLERMEELYEHFPSLELRLALKKLHAVKQALPEDQFD